MPNKTSASHLTPDDLEAALSLLASEASFASGSARKIIITSISDVSIGFMIFGFLAGLITLFYRLKWGLALVGSSVLAAILLIIVVNSPDEVSNTTKKIRDALGGSEIDEAAIVGWKTREDSGCVITLVLAILVLSLCGLFYGCISQSERVVVINLVIGALSAGAAGAYMAVTDYKEFQYFSQVSKLRDEFQSRLATGQEGEILVSPKEKELLSQVETQQVNRNVAKTLESLTRGPTDYYSIAVSAEALSYLGALAEDDRSQLRQVIDALQTEPQPANAQPASQQGITVPRDKEFIISTRGYGIEYVVDDGRQRVDVVRISNLPQKGVTNAS